MWLKKLTLLFSFTRFSLILFGVRDNNFIFSKLTERNFKKPIRNCPFCPFSKTHLYEKLQSDSAEFEIIFSNIRTLIKNSFLFFFSTLAYNHFWKFSHVRNRSIGREMSPAAGVSMSKRHSFFFFLAK